MKKKNSITTKLFADQLLDKETKITSKSIRNKEKIKPSKNLHRKTLQPPTCDDRLIWDTYLSVFHYPSLVVADKIGIFPFLATSPSTCDDLAKKYAISLPGMEALLGVLTSLGFLVQHQGRFYITDVSRNFLLPESEFYWGGMFRLSWNVQSLSPETMLGILQSKGHSLGNLASMWEQSEMTFQQDKLFTQAMHSHSFPAALGVAGKGNFTNISRLLDVGGGSGCFCIAIALYHQQMHLTVMERPNVCKIAEQYIEKYQLQDRINTIAIDMFNDPWPTDYNGILFSDIFHDWDKEDCLTLAKRSFDALPSGGTIYIHEMLLHDTKDGSLATTSFSLNMVLITNGKQFTAQEINDLLKECGFVDISIIPTYAYYSLISASKP